VYLEKLEPTKEYFRPNIQARETESAGRGVARGDFLILNFTKVRDKCMKAFYCDIVAVEREESTFFSDMEVGLMLDEVVIGSHVTKRGSDESVWRLFLMGLGRAAGSPRGKMRSPERI